MKVQSQKSANEVKQRKNVLYRFKMDGCGHCVNSQGDWDEMCKIVQNLLNPDCAIAEVEQKLMPLINFTFEKPSSFPTHIIVKNGRKVAEVEDRSVEGLTTALRKQGFLKKNGGRASRRV